MKAVLSRIRHPEHRILTTIKIWYRLFNWFWLCFLIMLLILLFDFFCFVWICFEYYLLIDFYVLLGFWIFEGAGFDPKLDLFSHFVVPKLLLVPIAHGFVLNVWTGFAIYRPRPIYICFPKLWLDHPMPWTFFKWSGVVRNFDFNWCLPNLWVEHPVHWILIIFIQCFCSKDIGVVSSQILTLNEAS